MNLSSYTCNGDRKSEGCDYNFSLCYGTLNSTLLYLSILLLSVIETFNTLLLIHCHALLIICIPVILKTVACGGNLLHFGTICYFLLLLAQSDTGMTEANYQPGQTHAWLFSSSVLMAKNTYDTVTWGEKILRSLVANTV